jgi:hypothetical protein
MDPIQLKHLKQKFTKKKEFQLTSKDLFTEVNNYKMSEPYLTTTFKNKAQFIWF